MINLNLDNNKNEEIIIKRLSISLNYANASIVVLAGYGIAAFGILITILSVMALSYSFYLVKTLYQLKKFYWLITFFIMVFTPLILKFVFFSNAALSIIFSFVSLFMFYLFCWILKLSINQWLENVKYKNMDFEE